MKKKLVCRVCGFVIEEDRLGEVCPACGVKRKAFAEYQDRVSEARRRLLNLHLHSMVIHFPQAMAVMIFGLYLISLFLADPLETFLLPTVRVMAVLLPVSVVVSLLSGLFDGKTRFKTLNSPIVKLKITVAILFFLLSTGLALSVLIPLPLSPLLLLLLYGLNALFSLILGDRGGKLTGLEVPN